MISWMLLPLRRYAQFSGRSCRKEYWHYVLFLVICLIVLSVIETMLGLGTTERWAESVEPGFGYSAGASHNGGPLMGLFALATLIPSLAVGVRRLHDTDRSGWWLLIGLIPLIGAIVLLVFYVEKGTVGTNRFGEDPLQA